MKVACIDRQFLGGTCLNIGCIPSKALLDSSERYYEAKNKLSHHGIKVGEVSFDLPTMLARKDQVVKQLTGGVGFLFKKNKIDAFMGAGRIVAADAVEVKTADGVKTLQTKRILIATGSTPSALPGLAFDGKYVVGSTEALSFSEVPKKLLVVGGGYIGVELGSVWCGSDRTCWCWSLPTESYRSWTANWPASFSGASRSRGSSSSSTPARPAPR